MTIDLYATQEAIEKQQRSNTIKRFVNDLKKKTEKGDETSSYYGASLMKRAIEPMSDAIREAILPYSEYLRLRLQNWRKSLRRYI